MSETTEGTEQRSARTGPMAKRRTKRKKQSRGGGILALLLVLCIGGAVLWRYCELPVPAALTERAEVAGDLAAERLTEYAMTPEEVIGALPGAFRELL